MQISYLYGKIPNKALKAVIYGPEGIGKSTFASKFPTPLFFDVEESTGDLDVARIDPKPSSWTMFMEQLRYIKAHPDPWQTIVIDTADWAEMLCISEICATKKVSGIEDFGYGKGYVYVEEEFGRLLNLLNEFKEIGINVVFTAHAQMRKFEQPDELGAYDRWELKLEKKTAALLKEWADMVLFANYRTYVVNVDNQGAQKGKNKAQGGKRVMYTTHHPCWDAKNRHGLADELAFEYSEIAHIPYARPVSTAAEMMKRHEAAQKKAESPAKPLAEELKEPVAGFDGPVKQVGPAASEPPLTAAEQLIMDNAPEPMDGVPKQLSDLMTMNKVTVAEIQWAVSHCGNGGKGYYPEDTPIKNYEPGFVQGVLVGAWAQVFGAIQANRKKAS
jgi:hypothetical protein